MITGKQLFELHRVAQPYDLGWQEIGDSARDFHNRIAARINESYAIKVQILEQQLRNMTDFLQIDPQYISDRSSYVLLQSSLVKRAEEMLTEDFHGMPTTATDD